MVYLFHVPKEPSGKVLPTLSIVKVRYLATSAVPIAKLAQQRRSPVQNDEFMARTQDARFGKGAMTGTG
jgi:hypothetical protein